MLNSDDLAKFINFDEIELDETGKPKLDKVIKGLKETSPYLFKQEKQRSLKSSPVGIRLLARTVSLKKIFNAWNQ